MVWADITAAITNFGAVFTGALDTIKDSPLLMAMLVGGSLLPVGFKLFKKAKKSVR